MDGWDRRRLLFQRGQRMFPIERLQTVDCYRGHGRGYQGRQHDASRRPAYTWEPSGYGVHVQTGRRDENNLAGGVRTPGSCSIGLIF
jgi:hypothetical protein